MLAILEWSDVHQTVEAEEALVAEVEEGDTSKWTKPKWEKNFTRRTTGFHDPISCSYERDLGGNTITDIHGG